MLLKSLDIITFLLVCWFVKEIFPQVYLLFTLMFCGNAIAIAIAFANGIYFMALWRGCLFFRFHANTSSVGTVSVDVWKASLRSAPHCIAPLNSLIESGHRSHFSTFALYFASTTSTPSTPSPHPRLFFSFFFLLA